MTFPDFFIFFKEQLFLIFNQMLSIRAFGRRDTASFKNGISEVQDFGNLKFHQCHCQIPVRLRDLSNTYTVN